MGRWRPCAGYDVFEVDPAAGIVTAWIGTIADVGAAPAGLDLVAVGEITGRDPTVVVRPTASGAAPIRDLAGPILAETAGAEASTQAALAKAGVATPPAMIPPDDPAAPFDPTPLLDGGAEPQGRSGCRRTNSPSPAMAMPAAR